MQLLTPLPAFHPSYRNQQTASRRGLQRHSHQSQVDQLTIKAHLSPFPRLLEDLGQFRRLLKRLPLHAG